MLTSAVTLVLSACVNNQQTTKNMIVYINNGAIQCESTGQNGEQTAALLVAQGIEVKSTQCGHLTNVMVAAVCGIQDININTHEIAESDFDKARLIGFENVQLLKQQDNLGYAVADCQ